MPKKTMKAYAIVKDEKVMDWCGTNLLAVAKTTDYLQKMNLPIGNEDNFMPKTKILPVVISWDD